MATAPALTPANDRWARRLQRRPLGTAAVSALCLAALWAILLGDMRAGRTTTFGGLQLVPLLVAGWLLGPRPALTLTGAAVALRITSIAIGALDPITGAIQCAVAVVVGLLTIAAADRSLTRAVMDQRARGIRRLTRLLDAIRALGAESEPDEAIQEILGAASAVLGGGDPRPPWAALAIIEGGRLCLRHLRGGPAPLDGATFAAGDDAAVQRVLEFGGTVGVRPQRLRGAAGTIAARLGTRYVVLARVRAQGRAYGVLAVGFPREHAFDPEELRLLEAMGHLAGIAIDAAGAVRLERGQSERMRQHAERSAELEGMKREFLLLASHELRSPLAVARGYADMLRDGSLGTPPESFRRPLEVMQSKLGEIASLVDDMLETARLETGNLRLVRSAVDMGELVRSAVDVVRPGVSERHELEIELPGEPVMVRGDSERLRRIAVNLLDNAVKYSPAGGPVHCAVSRNRGNVRLQVSDHGVGIPEDALGRLFQRFGRIVTPSTSSIPGTGLGLYLCRELARAHGGDISVESQEGEGSTFTVSLPAEPPS